VSTSSLLSRFVPAFAITCLVPTGCVETDPPFGTGQRDDPTPAVDDDDSDDDDSAAGTDDDDSWPAFDDPCGTITLGQSGYSTDDPRPAQYLAEDVGLAPEPRRIRTGQHGDPASSLTVMWETDLDTEATLVQWGIDDVEENTTIGATFVLGSQAGSQIRVHEVRLCDLEPGTTLQYRAGAEGAWSDTFEYTTFDPAAQDLTFVIAGDSRGGNDDLGEMLGMAAAYEPRLFLHTGDMVHYGNDLGGWGDFWEATTDTLVSAPLVPVHGNHEGMVEEFFAEVAAPGNEQWFSMDFGPLHVAVLNDSTYDDVLDEQAAWLDDDLAQSTAPFTLVATHRPLWSSGSHGSDEELQAVIGPVLDEHGVDLVVVGHDHGYERTVPLYGSTEMPSPHDGTVYVTSGGGGAYLYSFTGDWFTACYEASFHHVLVRIEGDTLTLDAYRLDGSLMDTFVKGP
jgi:acid phosphatase type 7